MKLPVLKAPILVNIFTVIFPAFISWFALLFGIAHIFEDRNPNIPYSEHLKGVVITLCVVGVVINEVHLLSIKSN